MLCRRLTIYLLKTAADKRLISFLAANRLDIERELGPAGSINGVGDATASIFAENITRSPRGDLSRDERTAVWISPVSN